MTMASMSAQISGYHGRYLRINLTSGTGEFIDIEPQYLAKPEPHGEATEHFRKVILGQAENIVRPEQSLNVQKILDGIYKSAETGQPVNYA